MIKYELLPEQLLYEGTVIDQNFFVPDMLDDKLIGLTHTKEYIYKLNYQLLTPKEIRNIGFPMSEILVNRGKYIANGTYQCALYAFENGISMNIAGGTHHSFADHGEVGKPLPVDGGYAEAVIEEFRREGVDDDALAARLQREGVDAFATSWHALLSRIREKCAVPAERT